jgi:hypothetical protein
MTPAYAGRQRRDAAIPQHSEPGASPTLPPGFERLSCRARARRFFNLSSQINEMPFLQRDFQTTIGDVRLDIGSTPIPCYGCEASLLLPQQFPVTYAAELAPFSLEKPGFTRVSGVRALPFPDSLRFFPVFGPKEAGDRFVWDCLHHQCTFVAVRECAAMFENIRRYLGYHRPLRESETRRAQAGAAVDMRA